MVIEWVIVSMVDLKPFRDWPVNSLVNYPV